MRTQQEETNSANESTTPEQPKEHALTTYKPLEARIKKGDLDALLARWEFGRKLLEERGDAKRLPNRRLEELSNALGNARSELQNRVQFAEQYSSDAEVRAAFAEHGSWFAICQRGIGKRASGGERSHAQRVLQSEKQLETEIAKIAASLQGGRLWALAKDVIDDPDCVANGEDLIALTRHLQTIQHTGGVWIDGIRRKVAKDPVAWEKRGRTLLTLVKPGRDRITDSTPAKSQRVARAQTRAIPDKKSLRVLSCVPRQQYTFTDKLRWVEEQIEKHTPDVLVLPQEFHGGVQCLFFKKQMKEAASGNTPEKMSYAPEEITTPYTALATKHGVGIIVGAVIDCPDVRERRERIYVIDPNDGVTGHTEGSLYPYLSGQIALQHSLGRPVTVERALGSILQAHHCVGPRRQRSERNQGLRGA